MAVNIKCFAAESVTLGPSDEGNLKVSPHFLPGETFLIFEEEQAHELYAEVGKMIAELWPPAEEPKPEPLSIEDFEDDKIEVGLETRGGSLVVEVGITEAGNEDETYAVWLTEAQTEELIASLEAHKKYVAQENAKPKAVAGPFRGIIGGLSVKPICETGKTPYGLWEGRLFSGIDCGTIKISSPAEPKPAPKTYTITINLKE